MREVPALRGLALTGLAAILVACQGGGAATPAPTGGQPATAAPTDGTSGGIEPETKDFTVAFGGPGVSTVALLTAIDVLNADGWTIDTPELSAGELQLQGVASGEFQISSGNGPNAVALAQKGAPIKIVMSRIKNEWTLYAKSEITQCADLEGVRLAIHSEGSPATFMTRNWIEQNCPGTKPEYIILPGSENRFAALLADEIDASPIELSDAIALEAQGGDRFTRLTSFAETLPDLVPTPIYANSDWAAENPNTLTLFLAEVLRQQRRFNEDPAYFKQQVVETLEGVNQENLDATISAYVDLVMYDPTGGITPEQQQYTIGFLEQAGAIEPGLDPSTAYDRTYLERALELLDS